MILLIMYKESDLTRKIIGIAMKIHREIGPGFQERVYHKAMILDLEKENLTADSEKKFDILYQNKHVGTFILDLVVEGKIVVELKAISGEIPKLFYSQIISYLKASGLEIGLLINFCNDSLDIKRFANYKNFKQYN
ncbi:MAG: GxxExxY protein [Candidatus Magasanikbacteria bacterium CG_4_10_14_0_2_um_filter_33_14]|uniref:GxxExxY protein n=1 Tax=Candidatus Magasanikbacteria bacterium CG_4_10_14_0_2_um_filter_33_14 TaxID=1974636 RepID=A0A2M7V8U3_9BACT|nr:MAG: GxxExxY protein [Candidatus Magasanikbacteria bacterium CG_4_10_14_0_2_um_filter_33_14]